MTRLIALCLIAAIVVPPRVLGQLTHLEEPESEVYDCGTLALYYLLRIEGRPTKLTTIVSHLPAAPPAGYSMTELKDAAHACGLGLAGIRLKNATGELDRPMIALLKRGHYVVVRPVGHSGKLVQVLSGVDRTLILDKEALLRWNDWTGLVLSPRRTDRAYWFIMLLLCLSTLGLLVCLLPKRKSFPANRLHGSTETPSIQYDQSIGPT